MAPGKSLCTGTLCFCHLEGPICPSRHHVTQLDHKGRDAAAMGMAPGSQGRDLRQEGQRGQEKRPGNPVMTLRGQGLGQKEEAQLGHKRRGKCGGGYSFGSCLANSLPIPTTSASLPPCS